MSVIKFVGRLITPLIYGLMALVFADLSRASAAPNVVVSLKPLHSVVAGVMEGVAAPSLLLSGLETPHSFALKPSHARELQRADAVFWVGPQLEQFLIKPIKTLAKGATVIGFARLVPLLPNREEALWMHSGLHGDKAAHAHDDAHGHGELDPHFWLDPVRVSDIVPIIVQTLSKIDPAHAANYGANGVRLRRRLYELHRHLEALTAPVRNVPYLVLHDAYQYLEARYRLGAVGSFVLNPESGPGVRRIAAIRRIIEKNNIRCVFREPQLAQLGLSAVSDMAKLKIDELDPLGATHIPGPDAYFGILMGLARKLASCLKLGER
jgi:zinc transport system substrate-binding protein